MISDYTKMIKNLYYNNVTKTFNSVLLRYEVVSIPRSNKIQDILRKPNLYEWSPFHHNNAATYYHSGNGTYI